MPKKLRRAGADWRVLVHEPDGKTHDIRSGPYKGRQHELEVRHPIPGTEFDELVVGKFLHLEQTGTGTWWLNVGGVTISVTADRDGRPTHVLVEGPNGNHGATEGVEYELVWNGHHEKFTGVADE